MDNATRNHPAPSVGGRVVAAHGRHFLVRTPAGDLSCVTRGKKSDVVCGDLVSITPTAPDQGVIASVQPRTSEFRRADAYRSKTIAANVTQVAIVVAPRPSWSEELLQRCLIAAESQHLPAVILANKADLPGHADMLQQLSLYAELGYAVVPLAAKAGVQPLLPWLKGRLTLLVGQSGMGKSTIVHALFPEAGVAIQAFSEALDSGRHTTTDSRLYALDESSALIDSPGLQEFALSHLSQADIEAAMPDLRPWRGQCRFRNCRHQQEPGCAMREAAETGRIAPRRLEFFQRLLRENEAASAI